VGGSRLCPDIGVERSLTPEGKFMPPPDKRNPFVQQEVNPIHVAGPTQEENLVEIRRLVENLTVAVAALDARMVKHEADTNYISGRVYDIDENLGHGETMNNKIARILNKVMTL
jgi:hypothetical protein